MSPESSPTPNGEKRSKLKSLARKAADGVKWATPIAADAVRKDEGVKKEAFSLLAPPEGEKRTWNPLLRRVGAVALAAVAAEGAKKIFDYASTPPQDDTFRHPDMNKDPRQENPDRPSPTAGQPESAFDTPAATEQFARPEQPLAHTGAPTK